MRSTVAAMAISACTTTGSACRSRLTTIGPRPEREYRACDHRTDIRFGSGLRVEGMRFRLRVHLPAWSAPKQGWARRRKLYAKPNIWLDAETASGRGRPCILADKKAG